MAFPGSQGWGGGSQQLQETESVPLHSPARLTDVRTDRQSLHVLAALPVSPGGPFLTGQRRDPTQMPSAPRLHERNTQLDA